LKTLLIVRAPGLIAQYYGFCKTHPNILGVFTIWDSIHSSHKFLHRPEYPGFLKAVFPLRGPEGPETRTSFEIFSDAQELKKAVESPVTQAAVFYTSRIKVGEYIKWWREEGAKHVENFTSQGTLKALWGGYPYEDP
jgi:hypothetical protein